MMDTKFAEGLIDFVHSSPTNYHVVSNVKERLLAEGYQQLCSGEKWNIRPQGKYFVTKNHSAVFAFVVGDARPEENGFKIICAHSDSPCFRIKPNAVMKVENKYLKLNTEVYGGPILYTWFDRPLSMAGRVFTRGLDPLKPEIHLIDFEEPLLTIPHLAIHFNRGVNDGNPLSKQKDMLPVLATINEKFETDNLLIRMISQKLNLPVEKILDFDLYLYAVERGCLTGLNHEFISCPKLDDLAMVHAGMEALLASKPSRQTQVLAVFDNEEVGSGTKQGAASPILRTILERVIFALGGGHEELCRALHRSFIISADMAHALHPNYVEKQDPTNHPVLNGGPAIKINANQKYMTDGDSASVFKTICAEAKVPCQEFVNHSDIAGGSTLGNILQTQMEVRGVDMGNPLWAMHSVREQGGVEDHNYVIKAFTTFYNI